MKSSTQRVSNQFILIAIAVTTCQIIMHSTLHAEDDANKSAALKSGLLPGEYVIPFTSMNVTGEDKGKEVCLICKNAERPVGIVFTRELTPAVIDLLDRLDAAIAKNKKAKLSGFAIHLTSKSKDAKKELETIARKHKISDALPLAFTNKKGPRTYQLNSKAAVTVMLYDHNRVKHNYAFAAGKLSEKDTDRIILELENMAQTIK